MSIISTVDVANGFLLRSFNSGVELNPVRLQRLMFLLQSHHGAVNGTPAFDDAFAVWAFGPVLPSLDYQFASFRDSAITRYGKDATGKSTAIGAPYTGEPSNTLASIIDTTWRTTLNRSTSELVHLIAAPGSAWANAYSRGSRFVDDADILTGTTWKQLLAAVSN